jgi:phenylacetate-CoA ligase
MPLTDQLRHYVPAVLPILEERVLPLLPFLYRGSRSARANARLLEESLHWEPRQFEQWKLERIRGLLQHAEQHVPYYRSLFQRLGFSARDLRSLADLQAIPPITKEEVKRHAQDLLSEKMQPGLVVRAFTGGSTGEPMAFFLDRERFRLESSFFYFIWKKYGHELGRDRVALFKANPAPDPDRKIFWRYDRSLNYLRFDSNYLNRPENFEAYRTALEGFGAKVLFGYPSSIHQLARMYQQSGRPAPQFKLVLLASENVYDRQRDLIQEVFRPDHTFWHYGHSEGAALAFRVPGDLRMQFVDLYGHAELLDEAGKPVTEPGRLGEIVATGYSRYMPFIRYRTSDYASLASDPSGLFASGLVVDRIEGRLQEFVVTRDERLVSVCTIGGYHFPEMRDLLHIQYFQDRPGFLTLRYVETPGIPLDPPAQQSLVQAFEAALRGTLRLELERVDEILLSPTNKKQMLVQKLEIDGYL